MISKIIPKFFIAMALFATNAYSQRYDSTSIAPPSISKIPNASGMCSNQNGKTFITSFGALGVSAKKGQLSSNGCYSGTVTNLTTDSPSPTAKITWSCSSNYYGGTFDSCFAFVVANDPGGSCGSDNGQTLTSEPTNLCSSGNGSTVISSQIGWTWTCAGSSTSYASCSASLAGACPVGEVTSSQIPIGESMWYIQDPVYPSCYSPISPG